MAKYYFGIDLGTTNSAISYIEESRKEPQVIRLADGKLTLPSCVMLKDDGDYVVGSVAYENRYKNNTVYSVKRFMGTDTKIDLISENGKHKSTLTPEEVSSKILRKLVDDAELTFGKGIVKDVVITVPAYFNNNQRRSTKVAGELAGLNVVKIINEPTSASLAYGVEKSEKSETVMVYDLGGGTFDVTILDVIKGIKEDDFSILGITGVKEGVSIIYSDGDTKLGGDDLDDILVDIFTERTKEQLGITIEDKDKEKYKLELEKVKKQGEGLVFVNDEASKGVRISKSDIAQATKIIYDRTKNIINRCLKNCGGNINFSKIVFVGGSTKNEHLKEMIQRDFPDTEIMDSYKPDESVALGASVQALANASGYMTISDVVPISIGLKTLDEGTEKMSILLRHGDNLPASKNMKFGVVYTDIGKVGLDIYQGDSRLLSENTFIGSLAYDVPKGLKVVEVKFQIDLNGVLICSVITPQGEEKIELTNIFSLEGSKPKAGDYVDTIEDKIERKKYLRWLNVMKRAEASPKDIEDFNKAFEKGKGATFIKKFKTKVDKNVNVTLDKIGE